jgi:hypothetical protein
VLAYAKKSMSNCICQFEKNGYICLQQKHVCVIATWFLCSLQHGMCVLASEKNKNMSDRN